MKMETARCPVMNSTPDRRHQIVKKEIFNN